MADTLVKIKAKKEKIIIKSKFSKLTAGYIIKFCLKKSRLATMLSFMAYVQKADKSRSRVIRYRNRRVREEIQSNILDFPVFFRELKELSVRLRAYHKTLPERPTYWIGKWPMSVVKESKKV